MNDFSDGAFGAVSQGFPDTDYGQCYHGMIASVSKSHSKLDKRRISQDLKSMQTIGLATVNEALHDELKKNPSETPLFQQFEQSY